ncbi:MAG: NAD-dependent epimerase/dehydratase family protein [Acidobacteriota bacterium]
MSERWRGRRVLVTGATGFLGSHLTRRLSELGADVRAWAGSRAHLVRLEGVRARIEDVDLRDARRVSEACRDAAPEVVFHLAAYGVQSREGDLGQAIAVNVQGTHHLLDAIGSTACRRVVQTGTWAEYAASERPLREEDPLAPVGPYATTKAMATLLACEMASRARWDLVVLRPFSVYGPREDDGKFVPTVIDACLRGDAPRLTSCRQVRDYVYVADVVDAYVAASDAMIENPCVVNVASGQGIALRDLALAIARHVGGSTISFGAIPDRPREIPHVRADIGRARGLLSWTPRHGLDEGIRLTSEWYATRAKARA